MDYELFESFKGVFEGNLYRHRNSTHGDRVALRLFEDIYNLGQSKKFIERVDSGASVVNTRNTRRGIKARRGDGSFGVIVPGETPIINDGFTVQRGPIATIQIGIEVKILMKAMIKQIDRVSSDLKGQAAHFKLRGGNPICVGIVGVNHAPYCIGYEGDREIPTDGKRHKHPIDEAPEAERRLLENVAPEFDEFLILRFEATNEKPFPFNWIDERNLALDYGAALTRISQEFEGRF